MRITCTATPCGNTYRFYRGSGNFRAELKPLVGLLLASHADIAVGEEDDEPALILTVGPMRGEGEAEFVRHAAEYIGPRRSAVRWPNDVSR